MGSENRIGGFNTFAGFPLFFLPGTLKYAPYSLDELFINCREESGGTGRFRGLEKSNGWPPGPVSFKEKTKSGQLYDTGVQ